SRRRHTRSKRDWSSDVCSSDLDKVVFLVDRKELDRRTSENFKAYAAYEPVIVDDTEHTYQLRKVMKSPTRGIVVTTTYKLSNLRSEERRVGKECKSESERKE